MTREGKVGLILIACVAFLMFMLARSYGANQSFDVRLTFEDLSTPENPATAFTLYQCVGVGCVPATKIGTESGTVFPRPVVYTDTIRVDSGGRTICYAVTASNSAGKESAKSNVACVTSPVIEQPAPNVPANLTATIMVVKPEVK